jgi:hypothetical protein
MPMSDLVEIGVYAPAQAGEERGEPLDQAMHRMRAGRQRVTFRAAPYVEVQRRSKRITVQ